MKKFGRSWLYTHSKYVYDDICVYYTEGRCEDETTRLDMTSVKTRW